MYSHPMAHTVMLASRGVQSATLAAASNATAQGTPFSTQIQEMPGWTVFSTLPEVIVLLATIPFIALGFAGVGVAALALTMGSLNRAILYIFLAVAAAFLGGLIQLASVLICEIQGRARMSPAQLSAIAVAIAGFSVFRFLYLYHRSQFPGLAENLFESLDDPPLDSGKSSPVLQEKGGPVASPRSGLKQFPSFRTRRKSVVVHSGSYERWGWKGDIVKWLLLLSIMTVGILEGVWRIGFISNFRRYLNVYYASQGFQMFLSVAFAVKFGVSAKLTDAVEGDPSWAKYIEVIPSMFALVLSFAVALANVLPDLLQFSETALGRLFLAISTFIFLIDVFVRNFRRPVRDSVSFANPPQPIAVSRRAFSKALPARPPPPTTSLPPVPVRGRDTVVPMDRSYAHVVRRSSNVPSWLSSEPTVARSNTQKSGPPTRQVDAPPLPRESSYSVNEQIMFGSPREDTFGMPGITSNPVPPLPSDARERKVSARSTGVFDDRGMRLSSPNLDLSFLSTVLTGGPDRAPPMQQTPFYVPFPGTTTAAQPARPAAPERLESEGGNSSSSGTQDSLEVQVGSSEGGSEVLQPQQSGQRASEALSVRTHDSSDDALSLSNFPPPPLPDPTPSYETYGARQSTKVVETPKSSYSKPSTARQTNLYTEDGFEFELAMPKAPFMGATQPGARTPGARADGAFDITSMIVGTPSYESNQPPPRRALSPISDTVSSPRFDSPLPASPSASEDVGEIRFASSETFTRGSLLSSGGSKEGRPMPPRAEEKGRVIPLALGQSSSQQRVGESKLRIASLAGGLPQNPRARKGSGSSTESSSSSQGTVTGQVTTSGPASTDISPFSTGSGNSSTTTASVGVGYDPRRPFERPRAAPLVLTQIEEESSPSNIATTAPQPSKGKPARKRSLSKAARES